MHAHSTAPRYSLRVGANRHISQNRQCLQWVPRHRVGGVVLARSNNNKQPFVELMNEVTPGKNKLMSLELDAAIRKSAEAAIKKQGYRVSVGDVAAGGGLTLKQAEDALRALAADSLATLQVANDGEIVYVFDKSFQDTIRNKSVRIRLEPALAAVGEGAAYFGRVAFGTALVTSVVAVYLAITVISSSGRDKDRNSGYSYGASPRLWFNFTDILWYWDPWYYRRRAAIQAQSRSGEPAPMSFLEAVFSYVFGDGDPNIDYETQRWEAIGRYIQYRGGVVTAEELAPFLDITPGQVQAGRSGMVVDESFVLPVLARLGGNPEVGPSGTILYSFPSLQQTAKAKRQMAVKPAVLEREWSLTEATPSQKLGVVALGVANAVGIVYLSSLLASPANVYALARGGMGWILGSLPLLQAYAAAFFAIPLVRSVIIKQKNKAIEARNDARAAALGLVQRPDTMLQEKLKAAESLSSRRVVSEGDVVFTSDKELAAQPTDIEADSFERRLERRASTRERQLENDKW